MAGAVVERVVSELVYDGPFMMPEGPAGPPPASPEASGSRSGVAPFSGYFPSPELGEEFAPFADLRKALGFVPGLYRAQTLLPRAIEAEARIAHTVLLTEKALSRVQKECLLLAVAAANRNTALPAMHVSYERSAFRRN